MLLAIDIGNSTIECGVFGAGDKLLAAWRSIAGSDKPDSALALIQELRDRGFRSPEIEGTVLCSVVPHMTGIVMRTVTELFHRPPLVITTDIHAGIVLRYADAGQLGTDRFVAAARAYALYAGSVIVVDVGTATTFSVIDDKGNFLGGAIAPGLGISAEALAARTAQLPRVDLELPASAIGRDTVTGIQSGLLYGHAAMIDGMIDRLQKELGVPGRVIATGGYASKVADPSTKINEVHPHLVLEGLIWLYRRLQDKEM